MSIASVFAGFFGCVTRTDHDRQTGILANYIATLKNPLGDGEIATVMAQMDEHLNIHRWWLAAALADPSSPTIKIAGDAEHQQRMIDRYEGFIAALARAQAEIERLKTVQP